MLNFMLIPESLTYQFEKIDQNKSSFVATTNTGEQIILLPPHFGCNVIINASKGVANQWYWKIKSDKFIDTVKKVHHG